MKDKLSFKKGHRARAVFLICDYAFLSVMLVTVLIPVWKLFVDSVDASSTGMRLWPKSVSYIAYKSILTNSGLYQPFLISIFTTVVGTVVGLTVITLGAYALMQKDLPGHKFFSRVVLITMMFNGGMIATYLTYKNLGLMNNFLAVIIPVCVGAYNTILIRSFFESLPPALFDAAAIDGCSPFGIFMKIVLPLSKPALASVGLFIAVAMWNNYMNFVLYITKPEWQNFQVKIRSMILEEQLMVADSDVGTNMLKSATILVVVIPFLFVYPFIQKYFTKGVTIGAVKG